jgi:adenylyltransferase/sulfurtransferase
MGVLQALEAIKLITRGDLEEDEKAETPAKESTPTMLLFSGMADTPFRSVRMRGRRKDCFACSDQGGLTLHELESSLDYVQFCGVLQPISLLSTEERISTQDYKQRSRQKHVLIDVREKEHYNLCHLEGAINVPIHQLTGLKGNEVPDWMPQGVKEGGEIYVICRVGNDSQLAVKKLKELSLSCQAGERFIGDIKGGMKAWKETVDASLPFV